MIRSVSPTSENKMRNYGAIGADLAAGMAIPVNILVDSKTSCFKRV